MNIRKRRAPVMRATILCCDSTKGCEKQWPSRGARARCEGFLLLPPHLHSSLGSFLASILLQPLCNTLCNAVYEKKPSTQFILYSFCCTYVYIYICMCIYICVCIYLCVYIYMYVCICPLWSFIYSDYHF